MAVKNNASQSQRHPVPFLAASLAKTNMGAQLDSEVRLQPSIFLEFTHQFLSCLATKADREVDGIC